MSARAKRRARDAPFVKSRGRVDLGSACVDIRLYPKTDVLVIIIIIIITIAGSTVHHQSLAGTALTPT